MTTTTTDALTVARAAKISPRALVQVAAVVMAPTYGAHLEAPHRTQARMAALTPACVLAVHKRGPAAARRLTCYAATAAWPRIPMRTDALTNAYALREAPRVSLVTAAP